MSIETISETPTTDSADSTDGRKNVTILTIHDLHGLVDGVMESEGRFAGGIDGIRKTISEHKDGLRWRSPDGIANDVYVFLVGDILSKMRHRGISDGTSALTAWQSILAELTPDGATFGNHEKHFDEVLDLPVDYLHCHNLNRPGEYTCSCYEEKRHYNSVLGPGDDHKCYWCTRDTATGPFLYCGVMPQKKKKDEEDPHRVAARFCAEHWKEKDAKGIRVLLAHYGDQPPECFDVPHDDYKIVLKAHDHCPSDEVGDWQDYDGKPIIVEAKPNGRSIGVLRLEIDADDQIRRWTFVHDGSSFDEASEWAIEHGLPDASSPVLLECEDEDYCVDRFGGIVWNSLRNERIRAACLGLYSLSKLFQDQKLNNHLFLMSSTSIRDDAIVPDFRRPQHLVDEWDIKRMFACEETYTYQLSLNNILQGLSKLLKSTELQPRTFPGNAQLVCHCNNAFYSITLNEEGEPSAARLLGKWRHSDDTPVPIANILNLPTDELSVTLPWFESERLAGLWEDFYVGDKKRKDWLLDEVVANSIMSGVKRTSIADSIARQFRKLPRPASRSSISSLFMCGGDR